MFSKELEVKVPHISQVVCTLWCAECSLSSEFAVSLSPVELPIIELSWAHGAGCLCVDGYGCCRLASRSWMSWVKRYFRFCCSMDKSRKGKLNGKQLLNVTRPRYAQDNAI